MKIAVNIISEVMELMLTETKKKLQKPTIAS